MYPEVFVCSLMVKLKPIKSIKNTLLNGYATCTALDRFLTA